MAKVTLDWKSPSVNRMAKYVQELGTDKTKEFANSCVEEKEGEKVVNKAKAKKWLLANCPEEDIEWKNKPDNARGLSGEQLIISWL